MQFVYGFTTTSEITQFYYALLIVYMEYNSDKNEQPLQEQVSTDR